MSSSLPRALLLWPLRLGAILAFSMLFTSSLLPIAHWPDTHEERRYHFMTAEFHAAVDHGFGYPRWLPNLDGGYGYPTFVFYQPGFFFVSSRWMQLLGSLVAAVYAAILTFTVLGGLGAFLLARELADEWAAWFGTALFLLTPYYYCNLLVRGDLSELSAMLIVPWVLYFAVRCVRGIEQSRPVPWASAGLGAAMAAIVYCHSMTAVLAGGVLAVVAVGLAVQRLPLAPLIISIAQALLVGAALTVFYALPMVQMSKHVDHRAAFSGINTCSRHAIYPLQYLESKWGYGGSAPGTEDEMSFQLGLPHFAIALAGLIAAWRNRIYRSAFAAYAVLLVGATHWFGWVWDAVPPLCYMQFPWRILSVTAGLQALLASGIHRWLPDKPQIKLLVYLALLGVVVHWSKAQFMPSKERLDSVDQWVQTQRDGLLHEAITYAAADEFRPQTAKGLRNAPPRGMTPLVQIRGGRRGIEPAPNSSPYYVAYQIDRGPPAELIINQAYFPGWHVELDGQPVSRAQLEERLTPDGRMAIQIESSGPVSLVAYYGGPPGGGTRLFVFLACLGAFGAWGGWQWWRMPAPAEPAREIAIPGEPPPNVESKRDRKRRKGKASD
jgi:hypothetical protein